MNRQVKWVLAALLSVLLLLAGCSQPGDTGSGTTQTGSGTSSSQSGSSSSSSDSGGASGGDKKRISVYSTAADKAVQDVYKEISEAFMQENPDIEVDLQFPGSEYENILKVKMAANDLPDVFDTHGWAIIRYGNYLADLRDEPWVPQMTDTVRNVVTDENGKVHVLVLAEAKDGITYNADVLEKYGIEPPRTFDELMQAADKLVQESNGEVTPFYFSGIDDWMVGQFFDYFATSLLISPANNEADNLLNGTMDWDKWTPLAEKFLEMSQKGYINKDVLTAKYADMPALFAQGKVAFALFGPAFAAEVYKINPDAKIGYMPVPAWYADDEPNFSGGERYTMGAWKDSPYLEESKKLIAYFAKPENMAKFANVTKQPTGIQGVEADHEFMAYYDKYANIRVFPYFDRVYLPNGMWDVMCKSGTALLAGQMTPQQFSEKMKQEVERLSDR